ncbi:hypothetical protein [Nonomuraea sp. KM88]|uniref:hypothetical protein n=1 Tax=Nonomuraea sp. KM88 TaxID=3457427 RepID=UPI003FCE4AD1
MRIMARARRPVASRHVLEDVLAVEDGEEVLAQGVARRGVVRQTEQGRDGVAATSELTPVAASIALRISGVATMPYASVRTSPDVRRSSPNASTIDHGGHPFSSLTSPVPF